MGGGDQVAAGRRAGAPHGVWICGLWGLLVATVSGPSGAGAAEPTVRVLLREAAERVEIAAAGERLSIRPAGKALRVGRRVRGPSLRLEGPSLRLDGRRYRGALEASRVPEGVRVVNELPLEAYVAGTILGEVHEAWGDAVLRAQAVAARTYVLYRRAHAAGRAWDVEAGTRGQVYLGLDGESPTAWRAVDATRGEVLASGREVILAAFHATAGGRTASAAEVWGEALPYLVSVDVDGEEVSPDTYWRAPVAAAELGDALASLGAGVGPVRAVEVARRTPSGRAETLRVRGLGAETLVSALALRRALGEERLPSTLFEVRQGPDGVVFVGSGRGHGVGMSQWGARALAERGASYRAILRHFYPGTGLVRLERLARLAGSTVAGRAW